MTPQITFYASQVIGCRINNQNGARISSVTDIIVNATQTGIVFNEAPRPQIVGLKTKINGNVRILDYRYIKIENKKNIISFSCEQIKDLSKQEIENGLPLAKNILDRQIVDINGRKLVRVNDIRLVAIASGTFVIAVDIGTEGLLRRLGVAAIVNKTLHVFRLALPTQFILWDDVEAFDTTNFNIKLSHTSSKLQRLHPSDLADIIEEMGAHSRTKVFESLDEEKAADVLEEMEPYAQAQLIESMSIGKAADLLEKMPADEVADLLDELEDDKVELLLNEMEKESSEDVRELLEYEDQEVGSIMTTDFLSFRKTMTIEETLNELRIQKPEADTIYSLFITDEDEKLIATVSLRNLVVSEPSMTLGEIMNPHLISVFDEDKINTLAEIISKYDLLAIPVTDPGNTLLGMVVIDDIVEDLMYKGKTKKGGRSWR
ncbi:MAG: CBS domain-containing protein [Paludibacter sp.]|nr:CBS domain-containing protein [Paludibacter sp.]